MLIWSENKCVRSLIKSSRYKKKDDISDNLECPVKDISDSINGVSKHTAYNYNVRRHYCDGQATVEIIAHVTSESELAVISTVVFNRKDCYMMLSATW